MRSEWDTQQKNLRGNNSDDLVWTRKNQKIVNLKVELFNGVKKIEESNQHHS